MLRISRFELRLLNRKTERMGASDWDQIKI